mmetsp:Transcript_12488/g.34308  ORF Transcript_12488/g.34308 Transcript_12488/m.34308 type:complete len:254 (-) Transcript_12488:44-805(-)
MLRRADQNCFCQRRQEAEVLGHPTAVVGHGQSVTRLGGRAELRDHGCKVAPPWPTKQRARGAGYRGCFNRCFRFRLRPCRHCRRCCCLCCPQGLCPDPFAQCVRQGLPPLSAHRPQVDEVAPAQRREQGAHLGEPQHGPQEGEIREGRDGSVHEVLLRDAGHLDHHGQRVAAGIAHLREPPNPTLPQLHNVRVLFHDGAPVLCQLARAITAVILCKVAGRATIADRGLHDTNFRWGHRTETSTGLPSPNNRCH